jgi:LPXTG-motif cell wall-anchored protein
MSSKTIGKQLLLMLTVGMVCLAFALSMSAQVQTRTSTTSHPATVETTVERGEVVYVQGNDLIVKLEDGSLRDFPNVPESARVLVDGREIGIHDLKVGMKLARTITTTSTPKTITTVQTVTGKVWQISPPRSVILTLEDGTNQQFTIPKDQKFNVDGQMVDAWGLKKGMKVSATKIVEVPEVHITHERQLTGSMPPPPPAPAPDQPILVAVAVAPANPAAPAPAELPKTGSSLPLIGLLGVLSLAGSLALGALRGNRAEVE